MAFFFTNLGARWGWLVEATPRPHYPSEESWYTLEEAASLVRTQICLFTLTKNRR
jgi:hypothetical protein